MRPVLDVAVPQVNGVAKTYTDYKDWRRDLEIAYGLHCIFCNDRLSYNIQVEHLSAQALGIVGALVWSNLNLACGPCNLAKSAKPFTDATHYLPNVHNTHIPFRYSIRSHRNLIGKMACIVEPNPALTATQQAKAQKTITDLKLALVEQTPSRERKMTDVRWQSRFDAYTLTRQQRILWDTLSTPQQQAAYIGLVPPQLIKSGYFSLWMIAFQGVPDVLQAIINTLPNTAVLAFDAATGYIPIGRNPGNADPI
jgi:hypothetical protein